MKAFIAGLIIGVLLLVLGVLYYFASGRAPAAVEDKPMPFEKMLAKGALHARIDKELPRTMPVMDNQITYLAGAQLYSEHCGICHGLPNMDQSQMAQGMFPKPPELFKGKGVTDDSAGETYWKVANGIRLTGMPEFKHSLSNTEMWQVSLLLANADKISDAVRQALKPPNPAAEAAPAPAPSGGQSVPGGSRRVLTKPSSPPPAH